VRSDGLEGARVGADGQPLSPVHRDTGGESGGGDEMVTEHVYEALQPEALGVGKGVWCRRSIQNVPLMIESKCTTLGVLFSNWVSVFLARVRWLRGGETRLFFSRRLLVVPLEEWFGEPVVPRVVLLK
jgi:hypothetical protein